MGLFRHRDMTKPGGLCFLQLFDGSGELPTDLLCSRFQDHIERRFCGTADPRKSTLRKNASQAPLTGLRSKI
jgi:hypothetical protein